MQQQLTGLLPEKTDKRPKLTVRVVDYRLIRTVDELYEWVGQIDSMVLGLDIETAALPNLPFEVERESAALSPNTGTIRLIQLAEVGKPVAIVDVAAVGLGPCREALGPILSGPIRKVCHNAKFEIAFLTHYGFNLRPPLFDTMLSHQLLSVGHDTASNLQDVARRYLNEHVPKEEQVSDWSSPVLTLDQLQYAARDASLMLDLRDTLVPKLADAGLLEVAKIEFDAVFALAAMESRGLWLSWDRVSKLVADLTADRETTCRQFIEELDRLTEEVTGRGLDRDLVGNIALNPNSPAQLKKALNAAGVPVKSVDKNQLKLVTGDYPVLATYLEWKRLNTAVSSASALDKHRHSVTGRVHTSFNQVKAVSGRLTCEKPSIQTFSAKFKTCVVAPQGYKLIVADYSQIELRIAAQVAPDERMLQAYRDGEDLHRLTAALVNDVPLEQVTKAQRQAAKAVNFGLIYGMGAQGLKNYAKASYGVEFTLQEAQTFRNRYFDAYAGVRQWHQNAKKTFYLRTASGRRRFVPPKEQRLTILANTPVQGLGADILKVALALTHDRLRGLDAYLVNTVHDEIVVEAREDIADQVKDLVVTAMVEAGERFLTAVPVLVEAGICSDWGEK
jgi:DNA polymerase-1